MHFGLRWRTLDSDDNSMGKSLCHFFTALIVLAAGLTLVACQTDAPTKTQYQAQAGELQASRDALANALDRLQQTTAAIQAIQQDSERKDKHLAELDALNKAKESRIRELESAKSKLEQLLNDMQMFQLNLVKSSQDPTLENLKNSSIAVMSTPIGADNSFTSDNVEAGIAHPANGTMPPLVLEAASNLMVSVVSSPEPSPTPVPVSTPSPSPTPSPTPDPNLEPIPHPAADPVPPPLPPPQPSPVPPAIIAVASQTQVASIIVKPPKPQIVGLGLGKDIFNRIERKDQKATNLFTEKESGKGTIFLYHRLAWYDKPGIFMEFRRPGNGKYQARIVVQIPDEAAVDLAEGLSLNLDGKLLPGVLEPRILHGEDRSYQYLVLNYDGSLATILRDALAKGTVALSILHVGGPASPEFIPDLAMKRALKDMMEAREDLR